MEGKTVILFVFIMSLVMARIQVVTGNICCPTTRARYLFDVCSSRRISIIICCGTTGCAPIPGDTCPPDYPGSRPENSDDAVNEYCKLGCTSLVCRPLTTLQNFGASEIGVGAVEQCANACSILCTKGSTNLAVETA